MCGIAGLLSAPQNLGFEHVVQQMSDALHHRGPDDGGVWVECEHGIALGHRRLSVIDLYPAWHQPATRPAP